MKHLAVLFFSLLFINCAGPKPHKHAVDKNPNTQSKPIRHVVWVEVDTGNEFWSTLKQSDLNVALIGTQVCPPCQVAKQWWEQKIAPPGWQFIYWQLGPDNDLLTVNIKEIFRQLQEKDNLEVPYLSIIEKSANPNKQQSITVTFRSLAGCTYEAQEFLVMHPTGTVRF